MTDDKRSPDDIDPDLLEVAREIFDAARRGEANMLAAVIL